MAALTEPSAVHWCDGSEEEYERLCTAARRGRHVPTAQPRAAPELLPRRAATRATWHGSKTAPSSARERKEDAGPTNNWMAPAEMRALLQTGERALFKGAMNGRTMYVVPFSMGPIGSTIAHIGVELSDSAYVAVNMRIMTRMGTPRARGARRRRRLRALRAHGGRAAGSRPGGRALALQQDQVHRPLPRDARDLELRLGLRRQRAAGQEVLRAAHREQDGARDREQPGWLAEHMLLLGVTSPDGRKHHVAAAFPSACGKTNFAMMIPPAGFDGWKVTTIGDDIAWIKPDADGRLYAINPEAGYFGVAPGTNEKTNPNCMASAQARRDLHQRRAHRRRRRVVGGHDGHAARALHRLAGPDWTPAIAKETGAKAAHPNARFTVAAINNPVLDVGLGQPRGRRDRRLHLRRPPLDDGAAGDRGARLGRRRLHGGDDGQRDHRRRGRPAGRRAARPVRDAALHRLQHERLLPALAGHGTQDRRACARDPAPRCRRSSASTGSARAPMASSSGRATARTCAC